MDHTNMEKLQLQILLLALGIMLSACGPATPSGNASQTDQQTITEPVPDSVLFGQGMEITTEAFGKLSGELKMALNSGGVASALPYCNLMAYPLTDSVAEKHGVILRRTALRFRNPDNAPTEAETAQLNAFAAALQEGSHPEPELKRGANAPVFYRPILLQEGCLKCHGTPEEDIAGADLERIRELYPDDKAVGFRPGELRGMWVLEFTAD